MKPRAAALRKFGGQVINIFSVSPRTTLRFRREEVQKQRVLVVAILALTCIAVASTFIFVASKSQRRVAAYSNTAQPPVKEAGAEVRTTLPMFRRLDANYMRG